MATIDQFDLVPYTEHGRQWYEVPFPIGKTKLPTLEQVKKGATATVPLAGLKAMQKGVTKEGLTGKHYNPRLPIVVQRGSKRYILDGHHRLTKLLMSGATEAQVHLVKLNRIRPEYQGGHAPHPEGPPLHALDSTDRVPKDVASRPHLYTGYMEPTYLLETARAIRQAKGNPDALVTVYRAAPKKELNPGDWISLSKEYAKQHRMSRGRGFKTHSFKVPAKHVRWAMDDIMEWGYFPEEKGTEKLARPKNPLAQYIADYAREIGLATTPKIKMVSRPQRVHPNVFGFVKPVKHSDGSKWVFGDTVHLYKGSTLSEEQQKAAIRHELTHIKQSQDGRFHVSLDNVVHWEGKPHMSVKDLNGLATKATKSLQHYDEYKTLPWESEAYAAQGSVKLNRSWLGQSPKDNELQGLIGPKGDFHPLSNETPLHNDLAKKLGFRDTEDAYDNGYSHVAIMGAKELAIHHPSGSYHPAVLRKFKELARSRNFDASLTLKSGDRLKTVPVKLARPSEEPVELRPAPLNAVESRFEHGGETFRSRLKPVLAGFKHRYDFYNESNPGFTQSVTESQGTGAHGVMAKVAAHFIHAVKSVRPDLVTFSAEEPSRQKLYRAMGKHVPKYLPDYTFHEPFEGVYEVRRKPESENLARKNFYGGWITPEGEFHANSSPYGHAATSFRILGKGSDHAYANGWVHVSDAEYDGILGLHHDNYRYSPLQIKKAKELARENGFDKLEMATEGLRHRIIQLARSKAPEGGIVVNNTYYTGGKFLPQIFKAIAKVRAKKMKPLQLARIPLPAGALGQPTLTHEQVTQIEDNYGLKPKERLPRTVRPDGTIDAKVEDITKFFNTVTKKEIGPSNLRRILKDPGTSDGVKVFHLVDHATQHALDWMDHSKSTGGEWYGSAIDAVDKGVKKIFPTMDDHKTKLFKMLVALTSYNTKPVQNMENAIRALEAGHKINKDRPFEHIPPANFEALESVKHLPKPGTELNDRLAWQQKHGSPFPDYMSAPVRVANGKVVGVETVSDGTRWLAPGYTNKNTQAGRIPLTDEQGNLRPKAWGTMKPVAIQKLQKLIHDEGSYAKAVEALDRTYTKKQFKEKFGVAPPKTDEELIPGSYVFGPKFGAFYQNLVGDKSRITMDKWFSRTFGRLLGDVKEIPDPKDRAVWKRAGELIAKKVGLTNADMQAILWYYEQNLWRLFGARTPSEDFKMGIERALEKRKLI